MSYLLAEVAGLCFTVLWLWLLGKVILAGWRQLSQPIVVKVCLLVMLGLVVTWLAVAFAR